MYKPLPPGRIGTWTAVAGANSAAAAAAAAAVQGLVRYERIVRRVAMRRRRGVEDTARQAHRQEST